MLKSYFKQDNFPPPPYNIILFELDFNIKFPSLRLLQYLRDLKSTNLIHLENFKDTLKKKLLC